MYPSIKNRHVCGFFFKEIQYLQFVFSLYIFCNCHFHSMQYHPCCGSEVGADWVTLGVSECAPEDELCSKGFCTGDNGTSLMEVVHIWVGSYKPSWEKLTAALRNMGEEDMAMC